MLIASSELYSPELLQVHVGTKGRAFHVPRGLICSLSEYFNKAFGERFIEGQTGSIELRDVQGGCIT